MPWWYEVTWIQGDEYLEMQNCLIAAENREYSGKNVLRGGDEKLFYRQLTCCSFLSRDHERRSMAEMRG